MTKNNNEFKISFEGLHLNDEQAKKIDHAILKAAMHEIATMDLKGKATFSSRPFPGGLMGYVIDIIIRHI